MTAFVVGVFYSLDALYGERRDRSILFWNRCQFPTSQPCFRRRVYPLVVLRCLWL